MGKIIFIRFIRETSLLFMGSLKFSRGGRDRKDVSIYWAHTLSHASQGILYVPHHGIARLKHPKKEGTSLSLSVTRKLALEEVKLPKSQVIIVQTSAFSLICSIYVSIVTTARERILGTEEWVGRLALLLPGVLILILLCHVPAPFSGDLGPLWAQWGSEDSDCI